MAQREVDRERYDDDVVMYTVAGKPLNLLTNLDSKAITWPQKKKKEITINNQ